MTKAQLFKSIFVRKSVRKYRMTPLTEVQLSEIQHYTETVTPLDASIRYSFSYLSSDQVKNLFPIKAPHYMCIFSEEKEGYLMNAGYILQQIDLYLSAQNLGSCWLGMARLSKEVPVVKEGMEFVIMLAFGHGEGAVHRQAVSEFKRKSLGAISDLKEGEELLEAVRLAPSASNSQPWFFSGDRSEIIVSREKLNFIKAPLYGKMNQIDIGIALCHLMLSIDHQGKTGTVSFKEEKAPIGYEFMAKVSVRG